ncbi:hypothetical protein Tco_0639472 [Tanacetum coccineum]
MPLHRSTNKGALLSPRTKKGALGNRRILFQYQLSPPQNIHKSRNEFPANTLIFQETHNKIDDILHEIVPQIAKKVTNDLIEYNFKPCIANTIIEDRDAFQSEVPALVSQEFNAYAPAIIEELFKIKEKEDDFHSQHDVHQDDDAPSEGEKRVKRSKGSKRSKSARGSLSKHSSKDSTKYVSKQQSQQQEWDTWEEENVIDEDEVIPEDETPELIAEF